MFPHWPQPFLSTPSMKEEEGKEKAGKGVGME